MKIFSLFFITNVYIHYCRIANPSEWGGELQQRPRPLPGEGAEAEVRQMRGC